MRPDLSFSRLQRAIECPASVVLPQMDSTSEARERGTAVHAFLAAVGTGKTREEALAEVPEEFYEDCAAVDLEHLPAVGSYEPEVAFAYDVELGTARELGRNIGREYGALGENELPGTGDVVALTQDGQGVYVPDFKTGWARLPSAKHNMQLRALGLAAARAYGRSYAVVATIVVHDDQPPKYDQATLDAFDLAETAHQLRELWAALRAPDARERIVSGPHCKNCPAFAACPAQVALVRQLATDPQEVEKEVMTLLTPETARAAWARWKTAEAVMARIRSAIYGFAAKTPIDLGNGLVLGEKETSSEKLDGAVVRNVLRERWDDTVADAAVEAKATKAGIERALKKVAEKGQLAALNREALELIRNAKGVTVKRGKTVTEFKKAEG